MAEPTDLRKLGTAFHESFSFSRPATAQFLRAVLSSGSGEGHRGLTHKDLRQLSSLGTNYIKSVRRYAYGLGLVDEAEELTPIGRVIAEHDMDMADVQTQWILHYTFAAPYRSGPAFWWPLLCGLRGMAEFGSADACAVLKEASAANAEQLALRTLRTTATVFLGTYSKDEGLGRLCVFGNDGNSYRAGVPVQPPTPVVAFAVADFWDHAWPGRASVNLSWLNEQGGPASLLLMNSGEMSDALREMQNAGLVEVHRVAPPYQVFRLWGDSTKLLERVYE